MKPKRQKFEEAQERDKKYRDSSPQEKLNNIKKRRGNSKKEKTKLLK